MTLVTYCHLNIFIYFYAGYYEVSKFGPFVFHFSDGGELDSRLDSERTEKVKIGRGKKAKEIERPTKLKCGKHQVILRIGNDEEIKVVKHCGIIMVGTIEI